VRIHCGILIPEGTPDEIGLTVGNETRQWEAGKCLAFDDAFEHEAWNLTPHPRLVLIVDVWHPEMDEMKRILSIEGNENEVSMYNYNKNEYSEMHQPWFNTSAIGFVSV